MAFADSALSIGRIGTETASSFDRNADAFFTASALNGAGDHCPMTAPEMIGPEYSSCTPPSGGKDPSAEEAPRRILSPQVADCSNPEIAQAGSIFPLPRV